MWGLMLLKICFINQIFNFTNIDLVLYILYCNKKMYETVKLDLSFIFYPPNTVLR